MILTFNFRAINQSQHNQEELRENSEIVSIDSIKRNTVSMLYLMHADVPVDVTGIINHMNGYECKAVEEFKEVENILQYEKIQLILLPAQFLSMADCHDKIQFLEEQNCSILFLNSVHTKKAHSTLKQTNLNFDFIQLPCIEGELMHRLDLLVRLSEKNTTISMLKMELEKLETNSSNSLVNMYKDLQQAYKELELRKKELESLDKAKSDFIKIVSHEIRTPLSGILGFSDLLKSKLPDEYKNYLNSLKVSAKRLQDFSNKAILISKLKTNSYRNVAEPISLVYIIRSILDNHKALIKEKNLRIRNAVSHRLINSDFFLIEKALTHVIDNAVRFAPENSTIFIEELMINEKFSLMVIDEGPGFSEEIFNTIFGLFAHGDNFIDKNVGLGLYMVKLIMNYMKGNIKVGNNKEGGAYVKLLFNV